MSLKNYIKKIFLTSNEKKKAFPGSKKYWENRYEVNRDSGYGSYGQLADFKADVLNEFVKKNDVNSVIEFGCGDGNQLTLAKYPNYIGFDVSGNAIKICKQKFANDLSKKFYFIDNKLEENFKAELVLSLDVIFHLIEDDIFDQYMEKLFFTSSKYVIIYSSNFDELVAPHVKCRKFTNWIEANVSDEWELIEKIMNKHPYEINNEANTSFSDFYILKKK